MRSLLRITAIAMVGSALLAPVIGSAGPLPLGGTFVDDDTSIHQESIEAIAAEGITRGCNPPANTWFCPEEPITRGQMAAFLTRALELPAAEPTGFVDTAPSLFRSDVDRLAAAGITVGCNPPENDRFCPDRTVSRGQMAAFLARALNLPPSNHDWFVDDDGAVFEADIDRLRTAGITTGCNPPRDDRFCPDRSVTRAEMAAFLSRAIGLAEVPVAPRLHSIDVVSREAWGAADPRGVFEPHEIRQITIHHAGDLDGVIGPAQYRSWQSWHHYLGWPDLAYHFIVGHDGKVYQGRPYTAVGDTATEYDPTGHFLIVVEGDFNEDTPTTEQLEMTAQLVAWASLQFGVSVETITGHRDHSATTCPGDNLYTHIHDGSLADRATEILDAGGVTLRVIR
jgi:hypothetical protein